MNISAMWERLKFGVLTDSVECLRKFKNNIFAFFCRRYRLSRLDCGCLFVDFIEIFYGDTSTQILLSMSSNSYVVRFIQLCVSRLFFFIFLNRQDLLVFFGHSLIYIMAPSFSGASCIAGSTFQFEDIYWEKIKWCMLLVQKNIIIFNKYYQP